MKTSTRLTMLMSLFLVVLLCACTGRVVTGPNTGTSITSEAIRGMIDKYRQEIPRVMEEHHIPGLAIAVVDEQNILWAEGFGFTDTDHRVPITPDTIFSIESSSKTFTATGVMLGVQDGLLDLDVPITTYLPDFTVHSIFEEHPERIMTLRNLLGHTAGFTHEAPVGNNWDGDATSFDAHIQSISETWLRFPVGTGYAYSNLGIDLAGYILQKVSGESFADYQRDHLFQPLGMTNSSFDQAVILQNTNRASGHIAGRKTIQTGVGMLAAGGMYSNVKDIATFLQFQLNEGAVKGQAVLTPDWLDEMHTVQFPVRGQATGEGLGVFKTMWYQGRNAELLYHGGFGWGFDSDLWWMPEIKLGVVVLSNASDDSIQMALSIPILDDLTHDVAPYSDRLAALPIKNTEPTANTGWQSPSSLAADIASRALPADPDRWQKYLGEYLSIYLNKIIIPFSMPSRIYEQAGALYIDWADTNANDPGLYRLYEVTPGQFFTETGQVLDFRTMPPTFCNSKLMKVGPGPSVFAWIGLAACGLVMLSILLVPLFKPIWQKVRRKVNPTTSTPTVTAATILSNVLVILTSLFGLISIAMLAFIPRLIYSGFLGGIPLPIVYRLLFHVPLGLAVCTLGLAILVVPAWRQGWWRGGSRGHYTALVVAALAETVLLASWHLIGLG